MDALNAALLSDSDDGRTHYYLGDLLYDKQPDKAIEHWEKAIELGEDYYIVYRNLGFAYSIKNNLEKSIDYYEQAIKQNPNDAAVYTELDALYVFNNTPVEKRLELLENNMEVVRQRDDTLYRYVTALIQSERYDEAFDILNTHHFHLFTEVDSELHGAYLDACLLRGKKYYEQGDYQKALDDYLAALEYPENLEIEIANPIRDETLSKTYYYIGTAYEALGNPVKAKGYYEKASNVNVGDSYYGYYKAKALAELGEAQKAQEAYDLLIDTAEEVDTVKFFAKFGQRSSDKARQAEPYYLKGLAYMGLGKDDQAVEMFEQVLEIDGNNIWARTYLQELR